METTLKEHQARLQEAIGSLDRYGFVPGDILIMLEAIGEFIDDEAHGGRNDYGRLFTEMQSALDRLKENYTDH